MSILETRIRGAGLPVENLCRLSPALSPSYSRKTTGKFHPIAFQYGKHVAHSQIAPQATTAGLEIVYRDRRPMRQCSCVSKKQSLGWPQGLHVFRRIVKKRTKPQGSNRPERRVPEATATDRGCALRRRRLTSPLLGTLSQG